MLARLSTLLLPLLALGCADTSIRHGVPLEVQRVSEWQTGTTDLAHASDSLGVAPDMISCSAAGDKTAVWSSYLEMVGWQPPLYIPQYVIVAHFDPSGRLLRVVAGDVQDEKSQWFFPSNEEFLRELSSSDSKDQP